jgi:hypothetical protein
MGTIDVQRVHGREDRCGEIVARCTVDEFAFAIARIIEGDRPPRLSEMIDLRLPDAFVGAYAMKEQDRRFLAAALLDISDAPPRRFNLPHRCIMGSRRRILQARLGP